MAGNPGFLLLGEAALRLGVSRLKLREAIAKGVVAARRDNEGRWRVDMAAVPSGLAEAVALVPAAPEALMAALFDEIEELHGDLEAAQVVSERLVGLAGGQALVLERVMGALEAAAAERDRFADVAGRALAVADEAEGRAAALQATTERALGLLERTAAALDGAKAEAAARDTVIAGHGGQLDRLFELSEQALEAAGKARRAPGLVARILGRG